MTSWGRRVRAEPRWAGLCHAVHRYAAPRSAHARRELLCYYARQCHYTGTRRGPHRCGPRAARRLHLRRHGPAAARGSARPHEPFVASHGVCAYNRVDKSAGAGRGARQGMPAGLRRLRPALRSRRGAEHARAGPACARGSVRIMAWLHCVGAAVKPLHGPVRK